MNNTFSPANGDELLGACIESAVSLTNTALTAFSDEIRQQINSLVFAGARVAIEIEMTPHPSVVCMVEAHGQKIELFRVESPPDTRAEITH